MSACPVAQPSKLSASVKIESCTDLLFATKLLDCFGIRSYKKHGDLRRSLMLSDVRFVGWQSEFSFLYCKDYSYDLWSRKLSVFFHEFVASNQHLFWCDHNHKLPRIIGSWNRVKERGMLLKKVFFFSLGMIETDPAFLEWEWHYQDEQCGIILIIMLQWYW